MRQAKPELEAASLNGLLIAEGDSWFDYPFNSVLGELENLSYQIESVAHKGDTAEEMAYDPSQLAKLAGCSRSWRQTRQGPARDPAVGRRQRHRGRRARASCSTTSSRGCPR